MLSKGISFQIGDGESPEVFSTITKVVEFNLSGTAWDTEELTNHDTTTPVRTFKPTLKSDGEVTLVIKPFDANDAEHALLRTMADSGDAANFKITYPGGLLGSFTLTGYVSNFAFDTPVDGHLAANVTVTVSGLVSDQPASIIAVAITDDKAGVYETGDAITLQATFDEIVKVTGTPRIAITLGSGTVYATYQAGTGTNLLTFAHTVQGGDAATSGQFAVTSPVQLNGGTINDMAGSAATLTFAPPNTASFTVN